MKEGFDILALHSPKTFMKVLIVCAMYNYYVADYSSSIKILWSHMLNECLYMHMIMKPNSLVLFNLSGYQTWSVLVYNVN